MLNIYTFEKQIINASKLDGDLRAHQTLGPLYNFFSIKGAEVEIHFKRNLTQQEFDICGAFVNAFTDFSVFETLHSYLSASIDPFCISIFRNIRAKNIELGITQTNKTTEVLGFFQDYVLLPGRTRKISLKGTLDSGSLSSSIEMLNYYIAHPELYADLAPFVTVERLTQMRTDIINYIQSVSP